MKIKFNEKEHSYVDEKGVKLLGVTTVVSNISDELKYNQNFIDKTFLGKRVHAVCEKMNKHYMKTNKTKPPKISIEPVDIPYILAYRKFLDIIKPKIKVIEKPVGHSIYKYAGTLDMIAEIDKSLYILDIKTSTQIAPYTCLQLSAYMEAWNDEQKTDKTKCFRRGVIHLLPDENFNFVKYPLKSNKYDFSIFIAKLKSKAWDKANLPEG